MRGIRTHTHGQDFVFARGTSLPAHTVCPLTLSLSPNLQRVLGERVEIRGNGGSGRPTRAKAPSALRSAAQSIRGAKAASKMSKPQSS